MGDGNSEGLDLNDPHPSIHDLFSYYNQVYFEGKLGACSVKWSSKRMTLCAGVCYFSAESGCEIRLSEPLLKFRPVSDLKNTLLHEMIHAYLFLTNGNNNHDDHGPRFQEMMALVNDRYLADEERPETGYAVTIYHNFTHEVDSYRAHQWRCPNCADLIKRAMNRVPSPSDCLTRSTDCSHPSCHWHTHKRRCGGIYEKIHEPEGYVSKRKKAAMPASAEGSKLNEQFVDKGDANLTRNVPKRKILTGNEGTSKKAAKGSPVPIKFGSLEDYFCKKDENTIAYAQRANGNDKDLDENVGNGPSVMSAMACSPVDMFREKKLYLSDDAAQQKIGPDTTDGGKWLKLERQSPCAEKFEGSLPRTAAEAETESNKETGSIARPEDLCEIISSSPSRAKRLNFTSLTGSNEASTSSVYSSTRKRLRTADLISKVHSQRNPLVILAWRNWVSYESDEDGEEPLINKRTERRRKERKGNPLVRPMPELSKDLPLKEKYECPTDMACGSALEQYCQEDSSAREFPISDRGEMSGKALLGDTFIDLSDDEGGIKGIEGEEHHQQQTPEHHRSDPEQVSIDWEDREDLRQEHLGREASETHAGHHLSLRPSQQTEWETFIPSDLMRCPICNHKFRWNEENAVVNEHIDKCLGQS